jgi:hypothetical protein
VIDVPAFLVVVAFTFATGIFHTLLGVERSVWRLAWATEDFGRLAEKDVRFTHRMLKHLSGWLPASNGLVIIIGLPALVWQTVALSYSVESLTVLGFWFLGQIYILTFGRIAGLVRDLRAADTDGPIQSLIPAVRGLIRQHFYGLLHASGTLVLQAGQIVLPGV